MKRLNEARKRPIGARRAQARRWNLIAVVIAVVTGLGAALLPLGMSSSTDSNWLETSGRYSLLSNEGAGVLVVVAIPAVLVAGTVRMPKRLIGIRGSISHTNRL